MMWIITNYLNIYRFKIFTTSLCYIGPLKEALPRISLAYSHVLIFPERGSPSWWSCWWVWVSFGRPLNGNVSRFHGKVPIKPGRYYVCWLWRRKIWVWTRFASYKWANKCICHLLSSKGMQGTFLDIAYIHLIFIIILSREWLSWFSIYRLWNWGVAMEFLA